MGKTLQNTEDDDSYGKFAFCFKMLAELKQVLKTKIFLKMMTNQE